ncbi:esterase/lipase family protein [Nocardia vulneris]|uniref:esterase/lipase family protein n=1 Tax=Nocardia vulneris TaxID=1141657 RepID=UPI00068C4AC1|nr:alpha/beta fold hydrolase [Nocardia vulneris]
MTLVRRVATALMACGLVGVTGLAGAPAHADQLPVPYGNGEMVRVAVTDFNGPVPGANDYGCTPAPEHPDPVVLITSTFLTDAVNWTALAPYLHNQGYCVFTFNYGRDMYRFPPGVPGVDPIALSAPAIVGVVDRVLAATGAKKVDLVGHSQGGLVGRYYINALGGADKVDQMVLISSPWQILGPVDIMRPLSEIVPRELYDAIVRNGVIWPGLLTIADPWVVEQATVIQPHIEYTQITDIADEMNLSTLGGMANPAGVPNARTVWINEVCPTDFSTHFAQPYSPTAVALVHNALDPTHPVTPPCTVVPFYAP